MRRSLQRHQFVQKAGDYEVLEYIKTPAAQIPSLESVGLNYLQLVTSSSFSSYMVMFSGVVSGDHHDLVGYMMCSV
ncbi:hypothetical protein DPMN_008591 [Dreissena polymorpha]|uniref:Uncharacterized protein n=1 Tax=Dreissena polymorpha TaxID=45954 RepID=A0A9D4RZD8_DREPO|nr:hypothetical protein DPMN_008591 [Dreissena polymorpha]